MRNKLLAVSLFAVVLAVILSAIIESPAFAAGDDIPIFVKPRVPVELLIIPESVNACPSALATVVPPTLRLNVPAVARLIAELTVRAER